MAAVTIAFRLERPFLQGLSLTINTPTVLVTIAFRLERPFLHRRWQSSLSCGCCRHNRLSAGKAFPASRQKQYMIIANMSQSPFGWKGFSCYVPKAGHTHECLRHNRLSAGKAFPAAFPLLLILFVVKGSFWHGIILLIRSHFMRATKKSLLFCNNFYFQCVATFGMGWPAFMLSASRQKTSCYVQNQL